MKDKKQEIFFRKTDQVSFCLKISTMYIFILIIFSLLL